MVPNSLNLWHELQVPLDSPARQGSWASRVCSSEVPLKLPVEPAAHTRPTIISFTDLLALPVIPDICRACLRGHARMPPNIHNLKHGMSCRCHRTHRRDWDHGPHRCALVEPLGSYMLSHQHIPGPQSCSSMDLWASHMVSYHL